MQSKENKKVAIIGGGFAGLSAACHTAKEGYEVSLYEKHASLGGRARMFHEKGFSFDMGPSWYWMPDIFEGFFRHFGKNVSDYYNLVQLDPGFRVFFGEGEVMDVSSDTEKIIELFESVEVGAGLKLRALLNDSAVKYSLAMENFIHKPGVSWFEYLHPAIIKNAGKLQLFTSIKKYVRSKFTNPKLIAILEFPVIFLGAPPANIPAMYSLMNHAAFAQGTWYPMGGMYKIIEGMESLAKSLGVNIYTNSDISSIKVINSQARMLKANGEIVAPDVLISSADYHHTDSELLSGSNSMYNDEYWESRTMAPSCLIYYLGIDKKLKNLAHHNLFFDTNFDKHLSEIYTTKTWPDDPLFYVCCPSVTDTSVAPLNCENLFVLVPLAPGLKDSEEAREHCFNTILQRLENEIGETIGDNILVKRSYCVNDFKSDYNAYKGNAYGLANTLKQTAVLKPKMLNKKVKNLIYTGQLTVPGPGVPPSIISGKIAQQLATKILNKIK